MGSDRFCAIPIMLGDFASEWGLLRMLPGGYRINEVLFSRGGLDFFPTMFDCLTYLDEVGDRLVVSYWGAE